MDTRLLEKIKFFIQEIHDTYSGIIKEITISKISKEDLKESQEFFGYKCSSTNLGNCAFMIRYTVDGKTRYTFGLPIDYGAKT